MKSTKNEVWRHNSFHGHAMMTQKNMEAIIQSKTATPRAKQIAQQMANLTVELKQALKERLK